MKAKTIELVGKVGFEMNKPVEGYYNGINWTPASYGYDQRIEQLIELVVKECIECIQLTTARDPQSSVQYKQSVGHIHRIREHFGFE